ncbi:MAG: XrtA-associated tyrosine autokinase [Burkholderiales bacterium]|nr:XrtA-associated tyrosine autokinase [Burkholderiales bacterium]MDE1925693.1 XrtA-associated tyrosine autokinase [Burkholderiales bacterium]MDE2157611.1 XrtA-associated tyrosine autokinase [Burkholderiales bacterium]MDE2504172.1 XrtA-associated tyrosine autokinase [Burkholderiales bacterium]
MSSLIEQAAQRLEQLRQAGVAIPESEIDLAPTPAVVPAPRPQPPAADAPSQSRRVELDLDALLAAGIVTPNAPRSAIADQYRVIKRPLIANALGRGAATVTHGNLIMITSAMAGEGKTFTSVNLAMSIASELDHTVMLVDADVARPSVLRTLGLPAGPGLLEVLEGKAELADVMMRTNVDKLTVLPAGTPHPKATELLASDAMRALLDNMATRYPDRIIIFDSPPLLLTTESRVLATNMGQIVVVVAAGKTPQSATRQALDTIESCPVRMLVLNKARLDGKAYGYGYGYGYGYAYGYGYGYGADAAAAPGAAPGGAAEERH